MAIKAASLLLFAFFCGRTVADGSETYSAVVVEYQSADAGHLRPAERVDVNVEKFVEILQNVSKLHPDIVVFPEYSLQYKTKPSTRQDLMGASTFVPSSDDRVAPCDGGNYEGFFKQLSCAAKRYKTYLSVDLMERHVCKGDSCAGDELNLYNTNVVFDRNGTVVARYRKYNLFDEPGTNVTAEPEIVTFKTDFGVTFGVFICFDIMNERPANDLLAAGVRHFISPSLWFSELLFLTAIQTQQMWSYEHDVALLAAGGNDPWYTHGGSGIYQGRLGPVETYFSGTKTTKILHRNLLKEWKSTTKLPPPPALPVRDINNFRFWKESYSDYNTSLVDFTTDKVQRISLGPNCCYTVEPQLKRLDSKKEFVYRFVQFSGVRYFMGQYPRNVEVCAVVACGNSSIESCGERFPEDLRPVPIKAASIEIKTHKDSNSLPNSLTSQYVPLAVRDLKYKVEDLGGGLRRKKMELRVSKDDLLVFGFYGVGGIPSDL